MPHEAEDNFLTANPTNTIVSQGGIFMGNLWGKVVWRKDREHWCVRGKWQGKRVSFSEYETALGKQTCQSEVEATQLQIIISNEIAHDNFNPTRYRKSKKLHLKKYAEGWLEEIKTKIATGTWHGYESAMRLYIIPTLGGKFLPDIGHKDLKELMEAMKLLAPSTRKNYLGALHRMMVEAKRDGDISQLPPWFEFTGDDEVVPPPVKYLIVEKQVKILQAIPEHHRPIFLFMMATGCRPSEARAFRKIDIDLEQGLIWFEVTFGKKEELKPVKSKRSKPFPITQEVREVIDIAPRTVISEFLFPNPATGRHYSKAINEIWNEACDDAKMDRFPLYPSTRHSYACQLLNQGVAKEVVARLLRHADMRTIDRYADYEVATLKKDAGRVTRLKKVR
jgi:integrase